MHWLNPYQLLNRIFLFEGIAARVLAKSWQLENQNNYISLLAFGQVGEFLEGDEMISMIRYVNVDVLC
jgi:hypothetical protein